MDCLRVVPLANCRPAPQKGVVRVLTPGTKTSHELLSTHTRNHRSYKYSPRVPSTYKATLPAPLCMWACVCVLGCVSACTHGSPPSWRRSIRAAIVSAFAAIPSCLYLRGNPTGRYGHICVATALLRPGARRECGGRKPRFTYLYMYTHTHTQTHTHTHTHTRTRTRTHTHT